jgi:hypothetical protein
MEKRPSKIVDQRFILVLAMMAILFGWLAMVIFWMMPHISKLDMDPMQNLVTILGITGIPNALIVLLTLSWQFYFRKKETSEDEVPTK